MLTGDLHYLYPGTLALAAGSGADSDVSADYALAASRTTHDRYVRWICTNGDPRDVRYYYEGADVTEQAERMIASQERAAARKELGALTEPYDVLGARVCLRPADPGQVWLAIDGIAQCYDPEQIQARPGLSAEAVVAYAEMRRRAQRIVILARAAADPGGR